jgi:predicted metal-dependent hydrolase
MGENLSSWAGFLFDILAPMPIPVDQIIRSKRKTIAIIVQRDGTVVVRAPLKAPEALIRQFVESKSGWINAKKAQAMKHPPLAARQFKAGEKFPFLGQAYPLSVVKGQKAALKFENGFFLNERFLPNAQPVFEKWYKSAALRVLTARVNALATQHGFRYGKIRITSARTRWGSCSAKGTLSFTWRLVLAPMEVVDYVVVHELAHLQVKNHSKTFWAAVAALMPDYKRRMAWLKANGKFLTLDGE